MRRQFGLKLLAQDACNLVYVMWRIEPESKIVVSIKSNPGQHASSLCGNRGYRNSKPKKASMAPSVKIGSTHTLGAVLRADSLRVFADGAPVWEGLLPPEAVRLQGPVGIRSDNARLTFLLRTPPSPGSETLAQPGCRKEAGE